MYLNASSGKEERYSSVFSDEMKQNNIGFGFVKAPSTMSCSLKN